MSSFRTTAIACMAASGLAIAREGLVGKYTGSAGGVGLTLNIDTVQDGLVTGSARWYGISDKACASTIPIRGKTDGKAVGLKGVAAESGCAIGMKLSINGNQLTGTLANGAPVSVSK